MYSPATPCAFPLGLCWPSSDCVVAVAGLVSVRAHDCVGQAGSYTPQHPALKHTATCTETCHTRDCVADSHITIRAGVNSK